MFQNNPLLAQLKQQLHKETPRIEGIVRANEKGFGFLDVDNNKKNYFIPAQKMRKLVHGDRVSGTVETNDNREQFNPETLIESSLNRFIARIGFDDKQNMIVCADHFLIKHVIRCRKNEAICQSLQEGDWVVAELRKHPLNENDNFFFAEVTEFIAAKNDHLAPWLIILTRHNLEKTAPDNVPVTLLESEHINRQDLMDIPFFTIDSESTRDMDDAIHIEENSEGHYILTIAIADPTAYIDENHPLDQMAKQRAFTTYLPDFNIPMLPPDIADNLCSLWENEKRPAVVCRMIINTDGELQRNPEFFTAWISSKAKLTYNQVSDYLENKAEWQPENEDIKQQLHVLEKMANARANWRATHALTFKDQSDYRFVLDENRQPTQVIKEERRIANKMVEEAMVVANQALAHELSDKLGFGIFNTHSGFETKYLDMLIKILQDNGITEFDKEKLSSFTGYCEIRRLIEDKPFLDIFLRRFQSPADFSYEPKPHYGLGFAVYTTWTSPIRKYSDMLNHRLIKHLIRHEPSQKPTDELILREMSERRKVLRYAENGIAKWLYTQYLTNKYDIPFTAEIIDINKGGVKVKLTEIGAIAFMPLSLIHSIKEDILSIPDEGVIKIKDEVVFRLADQVNVTLSEIKMDSLSIIVKREL